MTFTGVYEPVAALAAALDDLQRETGLDIPIHVDAASGGFIAPFIQSELEWDFRVERVKSISASGHKYGLAPLGVGWVVWRDKEDLPDDLIFNVDYLGGQMPTFALNFSRPGGQIIAQYYNFLRLGREGYTRIQQACADTAQWLGGEIAKLGPLELVYDGKGALPLVCYKLKEGSNYGFTLYDLSERVRMRGWLIASYPLPANRQTDHHPADPDPSRRQPRSRATAARRSQAGARPSASQSCFALVRRADVSSLSPPTREAMMAQSKRAVVSTFSIAMMTAAAVVSLRGLPMMAKEQLTLFVYIAFATFIFLIPAALVSAELGGAFGEKGGGVYTWVKEAFGSRWGFVAIWLQWIQNVVWYPTVLAFSAAAIAYVVGKPELANNGIYVGIFCIAAYWAATLITLRGVDAIAKVTSWAFIAGTVLPGVVIMILAVIWIAQGNPIALLHPVATDSASVMSMAGGHAHPRYFPNSPGWATSPFSPASFCCSPASRCTRCTPTKCPTPSANSPSLC